MQKIKKIIYWTSLIAILLLVVVPIIGQMTPLEFTNDDFKEGYEEFRFYGLPIVLLLTLFETIKPQDSKNKKLTKIVLTICLSLFSVFILFITLFAGMCRWTDNKVLFHKTKDESTKIILREYGCGATDSGRPNYKIFKVKYIVPYIYWVTDFDTIKIDKQIWHSEESK
jgi:uncharacterized BrkB/YihY/UPF0761 family membrane protein